MRLLYNLSVYRRPEFVYLRLTHYYATVLILCTATFAACSSGRTESTVPAAAARAANSSVTKPLSAPSSAKAGKVASQHGFPVKSYAFSVADDPHDPHRYSIVTVNETAKHPIILPKKNRGSTSLMGPSTSTSSAFSSSYTFRVKNDVNGKPLFPHIAAARSKPLDAGANGCGASDFYITPGTTKIIGWNEPDPNANDFPGLITEEELSNVPGLMVTMNPGVLYGSSDTSEETIAVPNDFSINQYPTDVVFTSGYGVSVDNRRTVQIAYPLDAPTVVSDATINVNAGDAATFDFSQDLPAAGGPITWIVWSTTPPSSTSSWATETTTAPHSNTLTISTDKTTPSGSYPIGVEVQSSLMCESSPLTTTIYVNVASRTPPPPTVDEVEQSPLLGQAATYNLQDAAASDMGTLDWNVTINDKEQPPYTLTYKTTSSAPHTNLLSFKTDDKTKPGRYSISATVTSEKSGATSPPLTLTLNALYGFTYSEKADSEYYTENGSPAPVGQSAFSLNPPIESQLTQYNDGSSDIADVDAPPGGTGTASVQRTKNVQSTQRHIKSLSGIIIDHQCRIIHTLGADAIDGRITVYPYAVKCDEPAQIGELHVIVEQLSTSALTYAPVLDIYYMCGGANICISPDNTVLPITNQSGYYTAQIVVAVNNGKSTAQIAYKLADTYFYNDANAIYPYLAGYNQVSPVPFPDPPIINCRQSAGNNGCPSYSSPALRDNLIKFYKSIGRIDLIPPGATKYSSPGYEPHHIKQGSCGGDDSPANGVFLTPPNHTRFTTWFRKLSPCGQDTSG